MDWKNLTMQFFYNGEMVTLQSGGQTPHGCLNSFLEGLEGKLRLEGCWAMLEQPNEVGVM
jgi:hypothetical protein